MVSKTKTFAIRGSIILLAIFLLGWAAKSVCFHSRQQAQMPPSIRRVYPADTGSASAIASLSAANAMAADPKLVEIMSRYRLGPKAARHISQAKMEIVNQTDTSVHSAITIPDKVTIDEVAR